MAALNSKHITSRKERKQRKEFKTIFPREQVEQLDRNKPALNKIMTTRD